MKYPRFISIKKIICDLADELDALKDDLNNNKLKGVIIIDGPDACGKTTLANRLIEKHGGIYMHLTYRFANKMPIYHAAMLRKALRLAKNQLVIIDRMHISEHIYAKVFRGGSKWPWMLNSFNRFCKNMNIPIVICVPDSVDIGVKWFEQTKKERFEMYDEMKDVIKEYLDYVITHDVIIYNRDFNDANKNYFSFIENKIKEVLNEQKLDY